MYLTRELTGATLAEIGHELGGKQHSKPGSLRNAIGSRILSSIRP
jgi:hypothetical protein